MHTVAYDVSPRLGPIHFPKRRFLLLLLLLLLLGASQVAKWLPNRVRCLSCAGTRVRLPFHAPLPLPPHQEQRDEACDTNGLSNKHRDGGGSGGSGGGSGVGSSAPVRGGEVEDLRSGGWNEQGLVLVLLRLPRNGRAEPSAAVPSAVTTGAAAPATAGVSAGAQAQESMLPPLSSPHPLSLSSHSPFDGSPGTAVLPNTSPPPALGTPSSTFPGTTAPKEASFARILSSSSSSSALVSAVASTAHACCAGRGPSQVSFLGKVAFNCMQGPDCTAYSPCLAFVIYSCVFQMCNLPL